MSRHETCPGCGQQIKVGRDKVELPEHTRPAFWGTRTVTVRCRGSLAALPAPEPVPLPKRWAGLERGRW
jgi:hypothetical protein